MKPAEIIAALEKPLQPLMAVSEVRIYFCHAEYSGIFHRYTTDGDMPIEFDICGSERHGFDVFVRKVGTLPILTHLPWGDVPEGEPLPESIFVPGDHFLQNYKRTGARAHANYGLYTELCRQLRPGSILEIGVRGGYSAYAMLRGAPRGASYLGVDLDQAAFDSQPSFGGAKHFTDHAQSMLRHCFPESTVTIRYCDTQLVHELPGRFDLVSVDGAHGHEHVVHDLELCATCAPYLIVDDVSFIATVGSGVEEFLARHPGVRATFYDTWRGHVLIDTSGF